MFLRIRWILPLRHYLPWPEHTKGSQGRNSPRARLVAYAPIRILNIVLDDPKARFCRSLASHSPPVNELPA
jgi:hypothetical protein